MSPAIRSELLTNKAVLEFILLNKAAARTSVPDGKVAAKMASVYIHIRAKLGQPISGEELLQRVYYVGQYDGHTGFDARLNHYVSSVSTPEETWNKNKVINEVDSLFNLNLDGSGEGTGARG